MMKIDWKKAPLWAKYVAYGKDGIGYFYSTKPEFDYVEKHWLSVPVSKNEPSRIQRADDIKWEKMIAERDKDEN